MIEVTFQGHWKSRQKKSATSRDDCVLRIARPMKTLVVFAVLLCANLACAGDATDPTLDRLSKVDIFAFGGIGYAGTISRGERDYKLIFSRTSAEADFERLFAVGNAQAKAYALVGIRALDQKRFTQISRSLRNSKEEVITESGCIVEHQPFGALLKRIAADEFSQYSSVRPTRS